MVSINFLQIHQSDEHNADYDVIHKDDLKILDEILNPVSLASRNNADTRYYNQATKVKNPDKLRKAIVKEVNAKIDLKHWDIIPREKIPKGEQVLPLVWAFKRKIDIKMKLVYNNKAILNVNRDKK